MKSKFPIRACAFGGLGLALGATFFLPKTLTVPSSTARPSEPATMRLPGVVRDFSSTHPDFGGVSSSGFGHSASNVSRGIGDYGQPVYTGSGVSSAPASALIATGTYVGNENDNRKITGVGFAPDVVIIKADDSEPTVVRTATMVGDKAKRLADSYSIRTNRIQSLDDDGFTLGSNEDVNDSGREFYWVAFKEQENSLELGSYTGNGNDNRYISGIGFRPDLVIVLPEIDRHPYHLSSAMQNDRSLPFSYDNYSNDRIQRLLGDGFEIGDSSRVNSSGHTYHYIAFKEVDGFMDVGSYYGNGWDNRDITGLGFKPEYLMVRASNDRGGAQRFESQGPGDKSLPFTSSWDFSDRIQELNDDGFQVGDSNEVNRSYTTYYYAAFKSGDGEAGSGGGGFMVGTQWTNGASKPMAPHLQGYGAQQVFSDFQIQGQSIVPGQTFAAMFTVLGASIYSGSYHMPVTVQMSIGNQTFEPCGDWDRAADSNINDEQGVTGNKNGTNPRQHIMTGTFPGGSAVTVAARSWYRNSGSGLGNGNWRVSMEEDSADGNNQQIRVLRNGDTVPNLDGNYGQDDVEAFLTDYITDGKMVLCDSQAVFLFELGVSGSSSSADFQDLVVLVTLADLPSDLPGDGACGGGSTDPCGNELHDTIGATAGSHGGHVTSAETFDQWFRDYPGVNSSGIETIILTDDGQGTYEYKNDEFYPIDEDLLGNEGEDHNEYFTYSIKADFVYDSCAGQFFEFEGDDDTWMFVDDKLVMDLGGIRPGINQLVELDRLGLNDGETYTWLFFHARRQSGGAEFHLRTNVELDTGNIIPSVSAAFD